MTSIVKYSLILSVLFISGCLKTADQKPSNAISFSQSKAEQAFPDKDCDKSSSKLAQYAGPDYEQLWDRIRAGYKLSYSDNARIERHLNWYKKHPSYMLRVSERAEKYLFYIVEQLEQRNMPTELAMLPIVESAFDPFAYSHGSASGMWQFISSTGKHYGLEQNWWYDGRRDVVAATDAALTYLADLHRRLDGDWLLALAAYNAGEGNVRKAIRRNKRVNKPVDFWSLKLPNETKAYVPQLLALSKVVMKPKSYEISLNPIPNKPYFKAVDIGTQIDLAQASNLSGLSIKELYQLNPGFNRWATAPDGPHRLLLPVEKADQFKQNLHNLPSNQRVSWKRYTIKSGDSLISIAKKFNTQVDTIRDTNKLRGNTIRAGKTLMIPVASKTQGAYALSSKERVKSQQARYEKNNGSQKIQYKVKAGDNLWDISRKFKVNVRTLAKWNSMAPRDTLRENQTLIIWSKQAQLAGLYSGPSTNSVIRKLSYRVRSGDSLARIADKFSISINDIARWNPVSKNNYIHPGQSLTLFVDVTRFN